MDSDKPVNIASLLGSDAYASFRHESGTKYLTAMLDEQPSIAFPEQLEHDSYVRFREQLAKCSTLAAMAGDSRLEGYVNQWAELQKRYANQVVKDINAGLKEQRELLDACDQELNEGEGVRNQYTAVGKKSFVDLSEKEIQELQELRKKVNDLNETAREREKIYRAVAGASRVEQTLTTLIQSGYESIHYCIPSVQEAQERLGKNTYDGPLFEPFLVSNRAEVRDIFLREVVSPHLPPKEEKEVRVDEVPAVLTELVRIYQHITGQTPGTVINPRQVSETLHLENIGVKSLGGYLDDNPSVFGVQKREAAGSRTFTRKEAGKVLTPNAFLAYMLEGKLQQHDARTVNQFYFQKALDLIREIPEAYRGFTKDLVNDMVEKHGLLVSNIYVARTLRNEEIRNEKGLELKNSETEEFVFREIIPTPTQVRYTQEAMKHFGISRFTPGELVGKIRELHPQYAMPSKVAEKVLEDKCPEWGIKVVSTVPLKYQRQDRSIPVVTAKKADKTDDTGRLM